MAIDNGRDDNETLDVVVLDAETLPEPLGPPADMSVAEIDDAKRQAHDLVQSLRESSGARQLAVADDISATGIQAQRNAGRQLELSKTRLATFLDEGGASKEIATGMVDLRVALNRINPALEQRGLWARTIGALPGVNGGDNAVVRALQRIALRFESVSKQVTVIETKLREGRMLLEAPDRQANFTAPGARTSINAAIALKRDFGRHAGEKAALGRGLVETAVRLGHDDRSDITAIARVVHAYEFGEPPPARALLEARTEIP